MEGCSGRVWGDMGEMLREYPGRGCSGRIQEDLEGYGGDAPVGSRRLRGCGTGSDGVEMWECGNGPEAAPAGPAGPEEEEEENKKQTPGTAALREAQSPSRSGDPAWNPARNSPGFGGKKQLRPPAAQRGFIGGIRGVQAWECRGQGGSRGQSGCPPTVVLSKSSGKKWEMWDAGWSPSVWQLWCHRWGQGHEEAGGTARRSNPCSQRKTRLH